MTQREKNRQYFIEFGGAMILYVVTVQVAMRLGPGLHPGVVQMGVFMLPVVPVLLTILAIVRHYRRSDEFVRKSTLEFIAVAAAVTAGWTLTYGFLENVGFPRLSMFTVWPVMGAVWALLTVVHVIRYR